MTNNYVSSTLRDYNFLAHFDIDFARYHYLPKVKVMGLLTNVKGSHLDFICTRIRLYLREFRNAREKLAKAVSLIREELDEYDDGWISIKDEKPVEGEVVQFTSYLADQDTFTSIEQGWWEGGYVRGLDKEPRALVMDYGDETDWYPCTHWRKLPKLPKIK